MEQLLVFAAIFAVMYFVLIMPQQRRQREAAALLKSLEEGDEVVLSSGIHGFISMLEDDICWIEVAEGVDLKVARSSVVSVIKLDAEDDAADDEDA